MFEAGGEDDRLAGARGDARAHEHEVGHVDGGKLFVDDRVGGLADGVGLAGEGDVDGRHLVLADEPGVGRDAVALFELHDVAGHEVGDGDDRHLAVAHHLGVGRHHLLQRLGGLLGAVLLKEADGRVEQHDADDGDGDVDLVLTVRAV